MNFLVFIDGSVEHIKLYQQEDPHGKPRSAPLVVTAAWQSNGKSHVGQIRVGSEA